MANSVKSSRFSNVCFSELQIFFAWLVSLAGARLSAVGKDDFFFICFKGILTSSNTLQNVLKCITFMSQNICGFVLKFTMKTAFASKFL